jgi:L-fucose isomerase
MIRVGILSVSDGRQRVHQSLEPYILEQANRIAQTLASTGEVETIAAPQVVCDPESAKSQAATLAAANPDAVIINVPVFAFPNYAMLVAHLLPLPCLAIAPINGKLPGLGGLQATVNAIRQTGKQCEKVWGNIEAPETLAKVMQFLRAGYAVSTLKGQVYGLIGGRSIGMASGAVNPDAWMKTFCVDVEHIDQLEIIRQAALVDEAQVVKALDWLTSRVASIRYDGDKLTPESLKMQIRCYIATKQLIAERKLHFVGVKCHYELSEYYVTQCLAAALCNDPYDWDGAKSPVVYSCEADSDGALTMQIMKLISGKPALFFDFRHYDEADKVFVFCNCGAMATWYAERSEAPEVNLRSVNLCPIIPKYGGQGCHVEYIAKEGEMTFGRLSRELAQYKFTLFKGTFRRFPEAKLAETCPVWPHGFVQVAMDPLGLIAAYDSNHIHGVYGDYMDELKTFCALKQIRCEVIE